MEYVSLFILGFSSLMPLINPVGTALIINPYFRGASPELRRSYSFRIVLSCFILGLATLFLGSWCLKFIGISVSTTQMAGGILIARMGLGLLSADSSSETGVHPSQKVAESLFYPLAFPLTLGPGCISVLIALSAHSHTGELFETLTRMGVLGFSLLTVLVIMYVCFLYAETFVSRIGSSGSLVVNRLMAFLVFCIGLQMLVTGLTQSFPQLFR